MIEFTFAEMKQKLNRLTKMDFEPELRLYFPGGEYMIIAYDDHCSFQRCGAPGQGSGEVDYPTLDDLYRAETVDGICLARDWGKAEGWECFELDALGLDV